MKKPRKHPAKEERISKRIYDAEQEVMREAFKDLIIKHGEKEKKVEESSWQDERERIRYKTMEAWPRGLR